MMKVKRYIIILITIFISMFISCKSVNKKLEKMNSFKFIGAGSAFAIVGFKYSDIF